RIPATRSGAAARTMARRPWCGRQRADAQNAEPGQQGRSRGSLRRDFRLTSRSAELSGVDTVALHLDVQRLVVDAKQSGRFALVPERGLKGQTDRLPLRLGDGALGDLLQRGALLSSSL